ncbi:MAG: AtpZ/AtpI family protein [Chloroflexota bacterium]
MDAAEQTLEKFRTNHLINLEGYGIIRPATQGHSQVHPMKKYWGLLKGYQLVLQISSILVCSVFGALLGGIWLDRKLGSSPCLMLVLMVVGVIFAMVAIYRTVNKAE